MKSVDNPDNPTALRVVVNLAIDGFTLSASSGGLALRYALRDQETFTNSNSQTFTTNVTELEIEGSMDGPSQPPLLIVVTNHPYLTNVILSGSNLRDTGRRVYVQLKSPTNAVAFKASTNNTPSTYWRLGMSAKNCASLDFTGLGGVELVGGLRTDTNLPDLLNVVSEDDPGGVDYVADQMMWLEDYRVP